MAERLGAPLDDRGGGVRLERPWEGVTGLTKRNPVSRGSLVSAVTGEKEYDAIIVGARCAGSSLAIALAERDWDVLVVDRDKFPSETVSTHFCFPNTVESRQSTLSDLRRPFPANP